MKVTLIDHMGADLSVVNAARVSFDKESKWVYCEESDGRDKALSGADKKLISYLAKHNHWTPFGHCFASFRIKAPIFVARQLGKHQVGLVWNEVSRRYVDSEPEFYYPDTWRERAENVKQGSSSSPIPNDTSVTMLVKTHCDEAAFKYKAMLKAGVCPEQARAILPQNTYTEWVWSGSLAAFARVCKLRLDPHTQYETQLIAAFINSDLKALYPVSWKALMNEAAD